MRPPYTPQANKAAEKVLKDRALQLAGKKDIDTDEEKKLKILEFRIADERYGMELAHISGIHPLQNLTFIPGTPEFIKGIINVHGTILSIVDLKKFFDLPEGASTGRAQVIRLSSEKMEFGVLADEVIGVKQIYEDAIQPSLPTLTGIRAAYLRGVAGDGLVILDGGKLLTDRQMIIDLEVPG